MKTSALENPLTEQVFSLPALALQQAQTSFDEVLLCSLLQVQDVQGRIILTGCGDSLAAAGAMLPAFESVCAAGQAEVMDPVTFSRLTTGADLWGHNKTKPLVITISNSGSADIILELLQKSKQVGAKTLFVTNKQLSRASAEAEAVFFLNTADQGNTPGLRSFFAGMVGLSAIACHIGVLNGRLSADSLHQWGREIPRYLLACEPILPKLARQMQALSKDWQQYEQIDLIGNGAERFCALFCLQKFYECGGNYCSCTDSEEWMGGNRYAKHSRDIGTIFLALSSYTNLDQLCSAVAMAVDNGRPVLVVTNGAAKQFPASTVICQLPSAPQDMPWLSSLGGFIPPAMLAAYCAVSQGRNFFGGCYHLDDRRFQNCSPYSEAMDFGFSKSEITICP